MIRKIESKDNDAIVSVVKQVLTEYRVDPATTVLGDPRLNSMYKNYLEPRSVYYVAEINNKIVGGCGIKQLDGGDSDICELQRMFLLQEARGKGIGKELLSICISEAKKFDYKTIYIESFSQMHDAKLLYKKFGFTDIDGPLGNTGHSSCDVNMILRIG